MSDQSPISLADQKLFDWLSEPKDMDAAKMNAAIKRLIQLGDSIIPEETATRDKLFSEIGKALHSWITNGVYDAMRRAIREVNGAEHSCITRYNGIAKSRNSTVIPEDQLRKMAKQHVGKLRLVPPLDENGEDYAAEAV